MTAVVEDPAWHTLSGTEAAHLLDVDAQAGLTSQEVRARRDRDGPNRLAATAPEPWWRKVLRQFSDLMIVILLVAAAVSLLATRTWETPAVIVGVVLLNATIGLVQESRANASLAALATMLVTTAAVRRDGRMGSVDAAELVVGDVVTVEAGDRVPADGRLLSTVGLEVQESTLTGEAQPVAKSAIAQVEPGAALGDRATALFMNTTVTRGRGDFVVTATGMGTEIGAIAHLLHEAEPAPSPLQRQIAGLGRTLAMLAGVVVVVVFGLGLLRGLDVAALFVSAVSLAVAVIPEGLPAVVTVTLAMGATRLARRGAVVKRLASVETLGATSQICTDKTGTLTLNQMTARELRVGDRRFTVSGEGYSTDGVIRDDEGPDLRSDPQVGMALVGMVLCADSHLRDGDVVGDPTEGALLVLAAKGGVDAATVRRARPRLREVPFDTEYKFMATFHRWTDTDGRDVVRCFVKGAPDVLAGMARLDPAKRRSYERDNAALAGRGMRVLAVGVQDVTAAELDAAADPKDLLDQITLLALVGIADPPRPEVRRALQECREAGIRVRMITGDHAVTAAAIASELGITGEAVTGAELDDLTEDDLALRLDDVGVVARVSPAHKLRIVAALQARGDVVAMTGDGVNDAPALRRADIGVAMGVTGTEVTKEAATMILTDDNFATVVGAVREGRGIYDNIVTFTRFQLSTAIGFVITFLVTGLTGIAGGVPFTAVQVLFVNLMMDGPPAMSLGVDPVSRDAMNRPPRPPREPILTRARLLRILLAGAVMAAGTLAVFVAAPGPGARLGVASVAGTMAFVTFVFFQVFNLLAVRHDTRSAFTRDTLRNTSALVATAAVVAGLVLVVQVDALHGFFTTTDLTPGQWSVCVAVGSAVLWVGELVKIVLRARLVPPARRSRAASCGSSRS